MDRNTLWNRKLEDECVFSASRSSGPGGQNVNKVNTKVELRFNINSSVKLSEGEKEICKTKLENKLTKDGYLVVYAQSTRSQVKNREIAIEKLYLLISEALTQQKKRLKTKPTRQSVEKRLRTKNRRSDIKRLRRDKGEE